MLSNENPITQSVAALYSQKAITLMVLKTTLLSIRFNPMLSKMCRRTGVQSGLAGVQSVNKWFPACHTGVMKRVREVEGVVE